MVTSHRGARHVGFGLLALLWVVTLTACQSTLSQPKALLDQTGSGSQKLPAKKLLLDLTPGAFTVPAGANRATTTQPR